ncbi:MAG TPA: MBL fold metallo-hydrolase [Bacteroidales bacterium]|nr:MBL fold metallo-hydrolase [Bacteroidales bacterium]
MPESYTTLRINGRGYAWPAFLGSQIHFKNEREPDLNNTSYSLIGHDHTKIEDNGTSWEILIDAGHGIVEYLIKHENRIPDAVVLTHHHHDHVLGLEWIIYSHAKGSGFNTPFPVYASLLTWEKVLSAYPQLESMVEFHELIPAQTSQFDFTERITLTPYPVYHGKSAFGPMMLHFGVVKEAGLANVLITGDCVCPLLRKRDYQQLSGADIICADSSNRFPYPRGNHWSLLEIDPSTNKEAKSLKDWREEIKLNGMSAMHAASYLDLRYHAYLDEFMAEQLQNPSLCLSVFEFAKRLSPGKVLMMHYSGREDDSRYHRDILSENALQEWANIQGMQRGLKTQFLAPGTGTLFRL